MRLHELHVKIVGLDADPSNQPMLVAKPLLKSLENELGFMIGIHKIYYLDEEPCFAWVEVHVLYPRTHLAGARARNHGGRRL